MVPLLFRFGGTDVVAVSGSTTVADVSRVTVVVGLVVTLMLF